MTWGVWILIGMFLGGHVGVLLWMLYMGWKKP
jgi:hypothetical protein